MGKKVTTLCDFYHGLSSIGNNNVKKAANGCFFCHLTIDFTVNII